VVPWNLKRGHKWSIRISGVQSGRKPAEDERKQVGGVARKLAAAVCLQANKHACKLLVTRLFQLGQDAGAEEHLCCADAEVVLKGRLSQEGFHVDKDGVMAKCPSKYDPAKTPVASNSKSAS